MKNIFYILLLFPTSIFAQYPSNSGQKITLGEQTTADGLVWRGRLADTANLLTNKLDTSVYIVLDTGTRAMWYYRVSTTPKWTRLVDSLNNLQGQLSLTTKVTGTLPLGNGGTGSATQNFVDLTTTQSIEGDKTFTSAVVGANFRPTSSTIPTNGIYLPASNTLGFSTNTTNKMTLDANGNLGIGVSPSPWTNFKAIQLLAGTSFVGFGTQGEFWTNSYFSGGFKYYQNGYATRFACIDGEYDFYTSSNNTSGAGATLTFLQIVKFDRNGNVGIGTTSPTAALHLKAGTASVSSAPLKFTSGVALEAPEVGAMEFSNISGTNRLLISPADNVRKEIAYTDFTNASGVLPVSNGGTNLTTFTAANRIPYASSPTALTTSSGLTFDGTNFTTTGTVTAKGVLTVNEDGVGIKNITIRSDWAGVDPAINVTTSNSLLLMTSNTERIRITNGGNVGIGTTSPTAALHLKAGTATANTAPLKFTSGTNLTTAEAGAMEFNGTNLFFSPSTTRHTVNHGLTGSATLDFPSTTTLLSADLTITVTGAADGDIVSLGVPNAAVNANTSYSAWVSAANTVTVRFNNYSSGTVDPASGLFKVFVTK